MAWLVPLLLLTVAITGAFSYYVAANQVLIKMRQGQTAIAKQASTQLDYMAETLMDTYNDLYLTVPLHQLLEDNPQPNGYSGSTVYTMIDQLMVTREFFDSFIIYSDKIAPIVFQNGNSPVMAYGQFKHTLYYPQVMANPSKTVWGYGTARQSPFLGHTHDQIFFIHAYQSLENLGVEGVVVIGINEHDLRHIDAVPPGSGLQVLLVDGGGQVMSDTTGQWLGQSVHQLPFYGDGYNRAGDNWILASAKSPLTGWQVVVAQPKDQLLAQLNRIRWLTLVFAAAVFFVGLIISYVAAYTITNPLRRFLTAMEQFQRGDFETRVETDRNDEIGQLGYAFNTMVGRIHSLIHDIYDVQLRQREAEVRLLQSQINPHFLYNTLNLIAWTAQARDELELADMIYALSNVFRTSLSDGRDIISLREELKLVENYLKLQQFRLPDRLIYQIDLPAEFENVQVPKLTVQPFVENAIVHGIEGTQGEALVEITVRQRKNGLVIQVCDNGAGMTSERLAEVQESLSTRSVSTDDAGRIRKGFAYSNVFQRLQQRFGPAADVTIDSTEGLGTSVQLFIPQSDEQFGGALIVSATGSGR